MMKGNKNHMKEVQILTKSLIESEKQDVKLISKFFEPYIPPMIQKKQENEDKQGSNIQESIWTQISQSRKVLPQFRLIY